MLHNSYSVNLLLTGVIIRLAAYPQPIIRSFLLHPSLVFQPNVKSLMQVIFLRKKICVPLQCWFCGPAERFWLVDAAFGSRRIIVWWLLRTSRLFLGGGWCFWVLLDDCVVVFRASRLMDFWKWLSFFRANGFVVVDAVLGSHWTIVWWF